MHGGITHDRIGLQWEVSAVGTVDNSCHVARACSAQEIERRAGACSCKGVRRTYSRQVDPCSLTGIEVVACNVVIDVDISCAVNSLVLCPAGKGVFAGEPESGSNRRHGHITHSLTAKTLLEQLSKHGSHDVAFDIGVAKHRNAHRAALCLSQCVIESRHATRSTIAHVDDACHSVAALCDFGFGVND